MIRPLVRRLRTAVRRWRLPALARNEARLDRTHPLESDPGVERSVHAALGWLQRAQDSSTSADGGVARDFDLRRGWNESYPETTGYIISTFLDCAERFGSAAYRERARRMLDWLVGIQFPEGGFQGGTIGATPRVPVTFNTGQILLGLAAGAREFGEPYRASMTKAADWLAGSQDADGCWRRFATPFAIQGDKTYETHVSWGLYEAARVEPNASWVESANRQVRWALSQQRPNGWFTANCLTDNSKPLTHTIGYALRGIVEAYRFTKEPAFLEAAVRCADGVAAALGPEGRLPGRLDDQWTPAADWVCLTGSVQIAHSWLLLYEITGDRRYLDAGRRANAFARRSIRQEGPPGLRGGLKGSLPVDGDYCPYQLPNWASKFFVDANLLEADITSRERT